MCYYRLLREEQSQNICAVVDMICSHPVFSPFSTKPAVLELVLFQFFELYHYLVNRLTFPPVLSRLNNF